MKKSRMNELMMFLALPIAITLTSCDNNNELRNGNTANISIPVNGETFGDEVSTRATEKPDTVRQNLGNGVIMEVSVTPDKAVQTRTANTVADNTQVLVAVYKGSTYYRSLTASISSGKISNLELPTGVSINLKFYAHGDKSAVPNTLISGKFTDTNTDLMYGHIDGVTLDSNGNDTSNQLSNGFTFKHLYTRARIEMTSSAGTISALSGLNLSGNGSSNVARQVSVNLSDGTLSNLCNNTNIVNFSTPTLSVNPITTGYQYFIANTAVPYLVYSGITVNTIAYAAKKIALNKALSNGISYTVKISLKVPTYNITYNGNNGTSGRAQDLNVAKGSSVSFPSATRSDCIFTGWYNAASGGSLIGSAGTNYKPTANITLYAHWKMTETISWSRNTSGTTFTASGFLQSHSYTITVGNCYTLTKAANATSWSKSMISSTYASSGASLTGNGTSVTLSDYVISNFISLAPTPPYYSYLGEIFITDNTISSSTYNSRSETNYTSVLSGNATWTKDPY
jgi:uncharacterized repeat protein (TIGR02543 family)